MQSEEGDWVLLRGHLCWQFDSSIPRGVLEEFSCLLLRHKDKFGVFEVNNDRVATLFNSVLIFESDWAVARKTLLLGDRLSTLMLTQELRHIPLLREEDFGGEHCRVSQECCSLLLSCEVIELVLVQNSQFRSVATVDELLALSPGHRAHVVELTESFLKQDAIDVHAFHNARASEAMLGSFVEEVAGELQAGAHSLLNGLQSYSLDEPARFLAINCN